MTWKTHVLTTLVLAVLASGTRAWAQDEPGSSAPASEAEAVAEPAQESAPEDLGRFAPECSEGLDRFFGRDVRGSYRARYRLRGIDGRYDNDVYNSLKLDIGRSRTDKVTAALFARLDVDVDGRRDQNGYYIYDQIEDTWRENFGGRLYYLYIDVHRVGVEAVGMDLLHRIRVGRQTVYEAEGAYFDGVRFDTSVSDRIPGLRFEVYGGVPVHLYETSTNNDILLGIAAEVEPYVRTKLRVDGIYIADNNDSHFWGDQEDTLFKLQAWHQVSQEWSLYANGAMLRGIARDVTAQVAWRRPEWDTWVRASLYNQFRTLKDHAINWDTYFASAGTYYPYWQIDLQAHKGFEGYALLDAGVTLRRLKYARDEGALNHEYERFFFTATFPWLPIENLTLGATGDMWFTNDDDMRMSFGLDGTYVVNDRWTVQAGTYYSIFKYDLYSNIENDNVRTIYGKATYRVRENVTWDISVEGEDNDFTGDYVVESSLRWDF